jgi:amino acid adenylation domain-containing protein
MTSNSRLNAAGGSLTSALPARIASHFEAQAATRPDAIALSHDGQSLTYAQLNARANRIAACLGELGVPPDSIVAVHLDRSFDLIAGILGILKAGAAYLPLDLASPEDRLSFMIEDAGVSAVLTDSRRAGYLQPFEGPILCLDQEVDRLARAHGGNPAAPNHPDPVAYVIYTSGSTGAPKGVVVTQANVLRLFSAAHLFHFGPDDVWTLFHSVAFDFSVWELFGALLHGGRLVIVSYPVSRSATDFYQLVTRERVTILNQTPSAFRQFIQVDGRYPVPADQPLRYIIFGGEALQFESLRRWLERHGDQHPRLVNMYGITETTVHVTQHLVTLADLESKGSNIGHALPDLTVYLVDEKGKLVRRGEIGEMWIGGLGVARGYLNRPELTRERFISNPFEPEIYPHLYRSGDLAREREDGQFDYLGRNDQQVKIRGFRVELSEIESMLARHPAVRECGVFVRNEDAQDPRILAYVAPKTEVSPTIEELRAHLAHTLPEYMLPAAFIFLSAFPLTLNGKLDRAALPAPGSERPNLSTSFVEPRTELEKILSRFWRGALRRDAVGVEDNFFDLGGDSLLLTTLHRQLESELERPIPITDLFQFPTIRQLAEHLATPPPTAATAAKVEARAEQQRAALARRRPPVKS